MLILTDSNELGDKRLDPKEGVAKLKEENRNLSAARKIPDQALLENQDMALGEPMAPRELIRRIALINPEICIEPGGVPGAVAVRLVVTDDDRESPTYRQKVKKYITGFYADRVLTEFSSVLTDKNGLATREIRGWRSVLLALLNAGALSYAQVVAAFGEPHGLRNSLWMKQTRDQRA